MHVAWKVGPSGDLATSAFAAQMAAKGYGKVNKGKAIASGFYVWWNGEHMRSSCGGSLLLVGLAYSSVTRLRVCLSVSFSSDH